MELADILIKFGLIIIIFLISLLVAMYSTYAERKIAAFFQDRDRPLTVQAHGEYCNPFAMVPKCS